MIAMNGIAQRTKMWFAIMITLALVMLLIPAVSFAANSPIGANCDANNDCASNYCAGGLGDAGDGEGKCDNLPSGNTSPSDDTSVYDPNDPFGVQKTEEGLAVLGTKDLVDTITSIINVALGLLGIVAVVIILIGGFKWMTGGGNEDKVGEARKLIFAGIIGLAIILSAWAIAKFVIESLKTATGSGVQSDA